MDIDPYEVLGVAHSATPLEVKKAYKKLSLKYHPDKIDQLKTTEDREFFPKIQFAYSILSDAHKRRAYDTTGSFESAGIDFDWKEYFSNMTDKITIEMIDEDKAKFQGSQEEKEDILNSFAYYDGDFLKLFEVVPHLEFDEAQESRVFDIVDRAVQENRNAYDSAVLKTWDKYKKSRKTKVKQVLKKMAKEAQEASALAKKIGHKKPSSDNDLRAMIQRKNKNSMDDLISNLEAKYGQPKAKKRSVPDDAEFDRIQQKMMRSKKKRT